MSPLKASCQGGRLLGGSWGRLSRGWRLQIESLPFHSRLHTIKNQQSPHPAWVSSSWSTHTCSLTLPFLQLIISKTWAHSHYTPMRTQPLNPPQRVMFCLLFKSTNISTVLQFTVYKVPPQNLSMERYPGSIIKWKKGKFQNNMHVLFLFLHTYAHIYMFVKMQPPLWK